MVLSKRKRDGEFVTWTPNSGAPELPDAKKARTMSSSALESTNPSVQKMSYDASTLASCSATPSTSSLAGPSQPKKTVKSRKKTDSDRSKPEKRGARFKASCPQNIMERVDRVMSQRALLTSELETIFANAPLAPNSIANPRIREAHARATGKATAATSSTDASTSEKRRIPGPDDDCPICYEAMHEVGEASLAFCEECGNAIHKQCFEQWKLSSMKSSGKLTCVYCRASWASASASAASGAGAHISRDGYLNLASVSGLSPVRDTSSYYDGPRRGWRGQPLYANPVSR
ncbi:hypothetical protein H0H92_013253 [Tricholoma furcatifolium]|nr:hypothetical protein H0H92_013253 [Tricholoma furcatifolium]